jgi:hypothetical protein
MKIIDQYHEFANEPKDVLIFLHSIVVVVAIVVVSAVVVWALPGMFEPGNMSEYPALAAWAESTGGSVKACAPTAWAALGYMGSCEPNIPNLVLSLTEDSVDEEVRGILNEGASNQCYKEALVFAFYRVLFTNFKTSETDGWHLSRPLLDRIYSGRQVMEGEDLVSAIETSLINGMPAIVWVKDDDGSDHILFVYEIVDGKFKTLGRSDPFDFRNGDIGRFDTFSPHMNFVDLRTYDGSDPPPSPESLYGDDVGHCFISTVW